MKTGKEIKINLFKNFTTLFGSVNNKESKAVFINFSAWAEPIDDVTEINISSVIRNMNKHIKQTIYDKILSRESEFIVDRTIVDFDLRKSGIKFGKRSFMNCEITLYLKSELTLTNPDIKDDLYILLKHIIKTVFESNPYFKFHKRKS
jgi:ribosome-associated translation inhibitor RaiA